MHSGKRLKTPIRLGRCLFRGTRYFNNVMMRISSYAAEKVLMISECVHGIKNKYPSLNPEDSYLAYLIQYAFLLNSLTLVNVYVNLVVFTRIAGTS